MNLLVNSTKKQNATNLSYSSIIFGICLLLCPLFVLAQSPDAFNYQAVVRDAGGLVISNQAVGLQLTLKQGSATGADVYSETFSPTTNDHGLISVQVGNGTVVSGDFTTIDWGNGPYFLETALDPSGGTSYTLTGTSQLLSVPYALYAKNAGGTFWNEADNGIHYPDGNVGVGTGNTVIDPTVKFQIRADDEFATNLRLVNDASNTSTGMILTTNGPEFYNFALGINNTDRATDPNVAYLWHLDNFDIRFGTNSTERLRIKNSGNIIVKTDDVYIETIGKGVIMKSPNGTCWRMTVDDTGSPVFTSVTCPN